MRRGASKSRHSATKTIDLSQVFVVGHDLRPVPHEMIDKALQAIEDMSNSYDLVGPARQIPSSASHISSSCTRETISQTVCYSLESTFIRGDPFFPKSSGLNLKVTLHDPQPRAKRHTSFKSKDVLLPYWASLIPIFAKSVLLRAKECSEGICPDDKDRALSSAYEAWARMNFPKNARITSSFPSPLGNGYSHLFIDDHKWRHIEHHFLANIPYALCLQNVSDTVVNITPLKILVPTDMDPIEKMALLAKYRINP